MNDASENQEEMTVEEKIAITGRLLYSDFYERWKVLRFIFLLLSVLFFLLYFTFDYLVIAIIGCFCLFMSAFHQYNFSTAKRTATDVILKRGKYAQSNEAVPFEQGYSINLVDMLDISFGEKTYSISLKYKANDWDEDDICLVKEGENEYLFHPYTFIEYMKNYNNRYLQNQPSDFIRQIKETRWLKIHYMNDSRSYFDISIDGDTKSIPMHYLTVDSYLGMVENNIYLISSNMVDSERNEIPEIITHITHDLWFKDTATFSEEYGGWLFVEE